MQPYVYSISSWPCFPVGFKVGVDIPDRAAYPPTEVGLVIAIRRVLDSMDAYFTLIKRLGDVDLLGMG